MAESVCRNVMGLEKFKPKREESALIVIDIQEKLARVMDAEAMAAVAQNVVRMVRGARTLGIPVIATEQYPKGMGETLPSIQEALGGRPSIDKLDFSCCGAKDFLDRLKETGANTVILVGMETHICVLQTALDLLESGYHVHVLADGVISRNPENKKVGLALMEKGGAVISSAETVLFQWLEKAGSEEFKTISRWVR